MITSARAAASSTEEPGARISHAGIREGAVGQLAVLPRLVNKWSKCSNVHEGFAANSYLSLRKATARDSDQYSPD